MLLNIHGEEEPYFEWLRMAEGICAGCAIVSEHSTDVAPLEPMVHLALGRVESLGSLCTWLAEDAERRERMRLGAYRLLVEQRPMSAVAGKLLDAARRLDKRGVDRRTALAVRHDYARIRAARRPPVQRFQPLERPNLFDGETLVLRALKRQQLAMMALRRDLQRIERRQRTGVDAGRYARTLAHSAGWPERPRPGGNGRDTPVQPQ